MPQCNLIFLVGPLYLNRLSDLLWLLGRKLEAHAGVDASLRAKDQKGARWSRAW